MKASPKVIATFGLPFASPDFNTFPSVSAGARAQAIDFG
jgi:hypothetical protein